MTTYVEQLGSSFASSAFLEFNQKYRCCSGVARIHVYVLPFGYHTGRSSVSVSLTRATRRSSARPTRSYPGEGRC